MARVSRRIAKSVSICSRFARGYASPMTHIPGPEMLDAALAVEDEVVRLRRELHQDPELGLLLPRTQARIVDALAGLGLEVSVGVSLSSVVADLDTGRPGPTVLLRADMDALPLNEDNGDEFASRVEGAMHACGHDTHVAMLVGAARLRDACLHEFTGRSGCHETWANHGKW